MKISSQLIFTAALCTTLNACVVEFGVSVEDDTIEQISFNESGEMYVEVDSKYEYDFILSGSDNIINLNGDVNALLIKGDLNQINITENSQLNGITIYGQGNDIFQDGIKVFVKEIILPGNNNTLYISEYGSLLDTGWNNNVDGSEVSEFSEF
jgi:hypothetical protein